MLKRDSSAGYSSATLATWPDGRESVLAQVSTLNASDFLFGGKGQGCIFVLAADFYRRARRFAMESIRNSWRNCITTTGLCTRWRALGV